MMKTFIVVTEDGRSLSVAQRLFDEENRVVFHKLDTSIDALGYGLTEFSRNIDLVDEIDSIKPDLVIFDSPKHDFDLYKQVQARGIHTFGIDSFSHHIANNDNYCTKVLKAHEINVPKNYIFDPESIEFVDISVDAFVCNGKVLTIFYTLSYKHLMNDDIGPTTFGMGTLCILGKPSDRLYRETISKLQATLTKLEFSGQISIGSIVTKNAIFGYDINPSLNYFTFPCFAELFSTKISDLFLGLSLGNLKTIRVKNEWAFSASVVLSPYPAEASMRYPENTSIKGLNVQNMKHIWFYDVERNGTYRCAATSGFLCIVSARGATIKEARRRVYRTIDNLTIENAMYRTDVGFKAVNGYNTLKRWNWIK